MLRMRPTHARGIRDLRTQIPRKIPADRERKVASSFSVLWIPRWPLYLKKNRGAMGSRTCLTLRDPSPGPGIVPARLGRYKDPAFPRHWRILRGRGFFLRATGHPPSHPSTSPGFFHTFLADRYLTGPGFNTAHIFFRMKDTTASTRQSQPTEWQMRRGGLSS